MPTVSRFYGISIIMRQREKEHNPPYIHAQMENFDTPFLIQSGEVMAGDFPAIGRKLVKIVYFRAQR